jgi:signal transduction histidine kinase
VSVAGVLITTLDTSARVRARSARETELELANQQLQDQAAELEVTNEELQASAAELEATNEELQPRRRRSPSAQRRLRTPRRARRQRTPVADDARRDAHARLDRGRRRLHRVVQRGVVRVHRHHARGDGGVGMAARARPAVLPRVLERWRASIATGEPFEMTFPLRGADGRFRAFLTRVTPVRDGEGRRGALVRDEHRRRGRARGARGRGAREPAKTDFMATMSHELRTPLNAIAGYAELLEIGIHGPMTDPQRTAISRIQRSQRHLLGLINDVLNFAKLEVGRVEYAIRDVAVCDVVDELDPLVAPQLAAKALTYDRTRCTERCVVRADADKLQQILLNVLSNAIKFTAPAGAITLRCREQGPHLAVAIEDTGIGIAPERWDDIFEPFVQIDRRLNTPHEGTGLGLAISRDLARGMGGDLTVESTPGVGSTFTLTLPRAHGAA